jgi:hypothetical protein
MHRSLICVRLLAETCVKRSVQPGASTTPHEHLRPAWVVCRVWLDAKRIHNFSNGPTGTAKLLFSCHQVDIKLSI